ncbi:C-C motif chemokine 12-like [Phyllobates terribilis]|uniref:C-C motif chemokine 12-like n=1 Tax=Phyllobates terribilis TaxID=111132 RepID=UPI003CCB0191
MKLNHISLLIFIGVVLAATQSHGLEFNSQDVHNCSEVQTRKVDIKILKNYTRKVTPIDAVLFSTKNGTEICADTNETWVKEAIIALDNQTQNQSPKTDAKNGSKKKAKRPANKSKKTVGKKVQGKQKKKPKPTKKAAPVMSIRNILAPRYLAVKP